MARPGPAPGKVTLPSKSSVLTGPTTIVKRKRKRPSSSTTDATSSVPKASSGYTWDSGSTGHSISQAAHERNLNDKNPLYDPSQQLSGNALYNAAKDLVGLQYDPQQQALDTELTNDTTQGQALADRAAGYYGQLADREKNAVANQQAIGQMLSQALGANATTTNTAIDAATQGAADRSSADAAVRGQIGGDPLAQVAAQAAQDKSTAAQMTGAAQAAGAAQTANYSGLADLARQAREVGGGENVTQLLNRLANQQADVRQRQGSLATQRGQALTKEVTDLRQQGFNNLATLGGLNIKAQDLAQQTTAEADKTALAQQKMSQDARQKSLDRENRLKVEREASKAKAEGKGSQLVPGTGMTYDEFMRHSASYRQKIVNRAKGGNSSSSKSKGPQMPASAMSTRNQIDNVLTDIKTDPKLQRHVNETGPRLVQILIKRGAQPLAAQAAAELARYGYLKPETINALKRAKINIPSSWLSSSARSAPPNVTVAPDGSGGSRPT